MTIQAGCESDQPVLQPAWGRFRFRSDSATPNAKTLSCSMYSGGIVLPENATARRKQRVLGPRWGEGRMGIPKRPSPKTSTPMCAKWSQEALSLLWQPTSVVPTKWSIRTEDYQPWRGRSIGRWKTTKYGVNHLFVERCSGR